MELKNGIIFQLVCPEKQQEGRSVLQYIPSRCSDGKCQAVLCVFWNQPKQMLNRITRGVEEVKE